MVESASCQPYGQSCPRAQRAVKMASPSLLTDTAVDALAWQFMNSGYADDTYSAVGSTPGRLSWSPGIVPYRCRRRCMRPGTKPCHGLHQRCATARSMNAVRGERAGERPTSRGVRTLSANAANWSDGASSITQISKSRNVWPADEFDAVAARQIRSVGHRCGRSHADDARYRGLQSSRS
jgi:hypothetical protein